ncbi:hypothetical protein QFC22_003881 [Naganishia vaughanmartiniae]|uniref:Uncharacterized protein n=1 Tax=Naganishia vaughanmartiniae TaxID=1424756 RepID=A0ACC2X6H3_9TREE|nr:hypothetical protein QFC22_003881 [Naganishia vaughanmartiniae]
MPSHDYLFEDPAESSTSSSRPHRAPKLKMKLKETDNERTERAWRKEQKRLRKETKKVYRANGVSPLAGLATTPPRDADRDQSITPPRKRRRSSEDAGDESDRRHAYGYDPDANVNLGGWDEHVWQPQPIGFEKLKAAGATGAEEEAWRQKMFDLMEDEEGPNPFVSGRYYSPPPRPPSPSLAESPQQRIPGRFKPPDGDVPPNFSMMDEEEYAEAIRYGMWRRQNKDEVERLERLKKLEEEEERKKARGKEAQEREEKKRIEVLKREKGVQETKRIQRELAEYKDKWEALRSSVMVDVDELDGGITLRMVDLPWPIFHGSSFHVFAPSLLSAEKIRAFYTAMIPSSSDTATANPAASSIDEDRAALKKILREAILAYHPDRFVGRYLGKVDQAEREMVKEAVIRTSQIINEIAADNK